MVDHARHLPPWGDGAAARDTSGRLTAPGRVIGWGEDSAAAPASTGDIAAGAVADAAARTRLLHAAVLAQQPQSGTMKNSGDAAGAGAGAQHAAKAAKHAIGVAMGVAAAESPPSTQPAPSKEDAVWLQVHTEVVEMTRRGRISTL